MLDDNVYLGEKNEDSQLIVTGDPQQKKGLWLNPRVEDM